MRENKKISAMSGVGDFRKSGRLGEEIYTGWEEFQYDNVLYKFQN